MNYLGLDYGDKHVGVAIATTPLAEPLTTLDTNKAVSSLKSEIEKNEIDELVIGDCPPDFLTELRSLGKVVHQSDETLSSYDARQALLHTTQSRRKDKEHAAAAAIILQGFLDSKI